MKVKGALAAGMTAAVILGACVVPAGAVGMPDVTTPIAATSLSNEIVPFGSQCIAGYNASMKAGTGSGTLKISYTVTASKLANTIGVSKIEIYQSTGAKAATIIGSVANGLLRESAGTKTGSYTYKGTSGRAYYAKVTLYVACGTTSDSRTVTTATVTAR